METSGYKILASFQTTFLGQPLCKDVYLSLHLGSQASVWLALAFTLTTRTLSQD